jgi:hypothetical protein
VEDRSLAILIVAFVVLGLAWANAHGTERGSPDPLNHCFDVSITGQ